MSNPGPDAKLPKLKLPKLNYVAQTDGPRWGRSPDAGVR